MAKTKRKHLAALAAMTEAGIMNDDMRKKVATDHVQGDSIQNRGCSGARADADTANMAGQTMKQLADGASSSKVQGAGEVAVKPAACTPMVEDAAGGPNSTPSIELRKQRIIIKIPPLPPKMSRKRQKISEGLDDHVKEAVKTPETGQNNADKSEVDSVATKRRKIGVDILKKNVSTLLADIDNTFSKVMLKLGDFKKERVLKGESRDSDKVVTGPPSTGEYPRKKPKLKNDILDIPAVAVRAYPGEYSEESTVPTESVPVAEDTMALSSPAAASHLKIPRKGLQEKSSKGLRTTRKLLGSCQQEQLQSNRRNENVRRSGPALHGRDPQEQFHEGAPGHVGSPHPVPVNNNAIKTISVVPDKQEPPTPGRSLRSRKGPLLGPDDLPVHKRRRRNSKTSHEVTGQGSGDGYCSQSTEGKRREDVHSTTREFNEFGGKIKPTRSPLGNGDPQVAGHHLDSQSAAQNKVTTSYIRTLKYLDCEDMDQLCSASQFAQGKAFEQKQKLFTILNQTAKGSPGHSARVRAYNSVLGVGRTVDIFTSKLKADGGLNAFLRAQGLEQFVPVFAAQKVDESALLQVTMDSLKQMGIHALGPRRKLIAAITSLCLS